MEAHLFEREQAALRVGRGRASIDINLCQPPTNVRRGKRDMGREEEEQSIDNYNAGHDLSFCLLSINETMMADP